MDQQPSAWQSKCTRMALGIARGMQLVLQVGVAYLYT